MKKLIPILLMLHPVVYAGKADVVDVKVNCLMSCSFNVTVNHADTGWDHYANEWQVVTPDGEVLESRVLYHPHVNEQPFTRSLNGINIPPNIKRVIIRAKDSIHGFGGIEKSLSLPGR